MYDGIWRLGFNLGGMEKERGFVIILIFLMGFCDFLRSGFEVG